MCSWLHIETVYVFVCLSGVKMTSSYSRLFRLRQLARLIPGSSGHSAAEGPWSAVSLRPVHTSAGLRVSGERRMGDALGDKQAFMESESDCYKEMPGKSTMTFLNDYKENFMVDAYSAAGFRINQGSAFIVGKLRTTSTKKYSTQKPRFACVNLFIYISSAL